MSYDLFNPSPLFFARENKHLFTTEFMEFLPSNLHGYEAFEREARKIIARGFKHYSARTIIHVLRHHSALEQIGGDWKLNNNISPYLARLWVLMNPQHAGLFEFRETKAVRGPGREVAEVDE